MCKADARPGDDVHTRAHGAEQRQIRAAAEQNRRELRVGFPLCADAEGKEATGRASGLKTGVVRGGSARRQKRPLSGPAHRRRWPGSTASQAGRPRIGTNPCGGDSAEAMGWMQTWTEANPNCGWLRVQVVGCSLFLFLTVVDLNISSGYSSLW